MKDPSKRNRYGTRTLAKAKAGNYFLVSHGRLARGVRRRHDRSLPAPFPGKRIFRLRPGPLHRRAVHLHAVAAHPQHGRRLRHRAFALRLSLLRPRSVGRRLGKISGYEKVEKQGKPRTDPFDELYIRTWRDLARYHGPESLGQEGPTALMRLPAIMEDILDAWDKAKNRPQFKAEYLVTHAITGSLAEGARVSAARLKMNKEETEALVNAIRRLYRASYPARTSNRCRRSCSRFPKTAATTARKFMTR